MRLFTKHLLLPWIPYWSPPHVAAWHGLASSIAHKITSALLTGPFQDYGYTYSTSTSKQEKDPHLDRSLVGNTIADANANSRQQQQQQQQQSQQQQRRSLIVYLTRPSTATRYVDNEQELLSR